VSGHHDLRCLFCPPRCDISCSDRADLGQLWTCGLLWAVVLFAADSCSYLCRHPDGAERWCSPPCVPVWPLCVDGSAASTGGLFRHAHAASGNALELAFQWATSRRRRRLVTSGRPLGLSDNARLLLPRNFVLLHRQGILLLRQAAPRAFGVCHARSNATVCASGEAMGITPKRTSSGSLYLLRVS